MVRKGVVAGTPGRAPDQPRFGEWVAYYVSGSRELGSRFGIRVVPSLEGEIEDEGIVARGHEVREDGERYKGWEISDERRVRTSGQVNDVFIGIRVNTLRREISWWTTCL